MASVDGIVSGIDTTSLINAMVSVQKTGIDSLKARKRDYERQREAVSGIRSRMETVASAFRAMDTVDEFRSFKVTSSAKSFVATASSGALEGTYSFNVTKLAQAQRMTTMPGNPGENDPNLLGVYGTGTINITTGMSSGSPVVTPISITPANNSLAGLAEAINNVEGLSAYVLDTGAPSSRYRILVQGATGAANDFTIDPSGLSGGPVPMFAPDQTALNAVVDIGGVAIEVSSNTLNGAIPGISLQLIQEGLGMESATVEKDGAAMRAKLEKVVSSYNDMLSYYNTSRTFNAETGASGPLVGESTTRRAVEDLGGLVSSSYTVPGSNLRSLAELGISTGRDGKLTLDTAAFDKAYAADSASVEAFLTDKASALEAVAVRIEDTYVDADAGILVNRTEGLDSTIEDLDEQIAKAEERLASQAKLLRAQFTAMETTLGRIQSTQNFLQAYFASSYK
jgi:flagellar hook-associated protein 2